MAKTLFDGLQLGDIAADNRILMAPLTRGRAGKGYVPTEMVVEYYRQRASAGLIISEATGISQEGLGWPAAPGIWTDEQVEGWKAVTKAVHDAGGKIILQLWHMGRLVHSVFNDGKPPISASATKAEGKAHTPQGRLELEVARPLEIAEIPRLIADYVHAAENAKRAGFDGVQIHAANGYLIDQFLRDGTNLRTDDYGGVPENRIRLLREITEALIAVWGAGRISVRLSPNGETQGVDDSAPQTVFPLAAKMLNDLGIGFLELREPGPDGTFGATEVPKLSPDIRQQFKGPLILNSDYTVEQAQQAVESGLADGISFGRPFISNPDLVERIRIGAEWAPNDMSKWYTPGPEGYIDYPALENAS